MSHNSEHRTHPKTKWLKKKKKKKKKLTFIWSTCFTRSFLASAKNSLLKLGPNSLSVAVAICASSVAMGGSASVRIAVSRWWAWAREQVRQGMGMWVAWAREVEGELELGGRVRGRCGER